MKMIRFIPGLFLLLAVEYAPAPRAAAPPEPQRATAVLHLKLVLPYTGADLGTARVTSFSSNDGKDYAKQFKESSASGIPYGIYQLQAGTAGYFDSDREVLVSQPEVWVVLGVGMGSTRGWDEGGFPLVL